MRPALPSFGIQPRVPSGLFFRSIAPRDLWPPLPRPPEKAFLHLPFFLVTLCLLVCSSALALVTLIRDIRHDLVPWKVFSFFFFAACCASAVIPFSVDVCLGSHPRYDSACPPPVSVLLTPSLAFFDDAPIRGLQSCHTGKNIKGDIWREVHYTPPRALFFETSPLSTPPLL